MHPLLFHFGHVLIPSYGVLVALAVLAALVISLWTARRLKLDGNAVWNMGVLAVFTALISARLLLILVNFHDFRRYPLWLLGLAMIPNNIFAILGVVAGGIAALLYAHRARLPWLPLADCLALALAFGHAIERMGCFLAGTDFGSPATVSWAVVYRNKLAGIWSGTPLGVPLHPVQLYEAGIELILGAILLWRLPRRAQDGELAWIWLFAAGLAHFLCELFRGDTGRMELFGGFLTLTQLFAVYMVLAGGLLLRKRDTVVLRASES